MKGDIVLKIIITFLAPFILMYSCAYFFYIFDIGFLSILNCFIIASIAYAMFFLRFGKINLRKIAFVEKLIAVLLMFFFALILLLLKTLIDI
ncbi:MAG: hypothetical protein LBB09_02825 [Rickettsiales bacterium]|jgi:hypothetical protein|nr:hypothetical protein [Rickettsiales bacterium]